MKSYKDNFIEGVHYYMEGERVIFMALFHLERGQCCGNGCRHCPYHPKHKKGTAIVKDKNSPEYIKFKENN